MVGWSWQYYHGFLAKVPETRTGGEKWLHQYWYFCCAMNVHSDWVRTQNAINDIASSIVIGPDSCLLAGVFYERQVREDRNQFVKSGACPKRQRRYRDRFLLSALPSYVNDSLKLYCYQFLFAFLSDLFSNV